MDTVRLLLQVPRRNIVRLCSIIEGYEGMAILRTIDPTQGLLELLIAPAFHATALCLLHTLGQELDLCLIDTGESSPTDGEPRIADYHG